MSAAFRVAGIVAMLANSVQASDAKSTIQADLASSFIAKPSLTIPLIPHNVQKERRLLETGEKYVKQPRPHHYTRRIQSDGDAPPALQVASLFQGYGTHYADMWCGTPAQRQTVIVDTGSGVTAFPCDGCRNCGVPDYHAGDLFHPDKSSTFHKLTCDECLRGHCPIGNGNNECKIGMSYQEGSSWNAYEAMDRCYIGGFHHSAVAFEANNDSDWNPHTADALAMNAKFGCQTRLTGLFITQLADGIMGMDNAAAAYWQQLYDAKKMSRRVFSLCFGRNDYVDPDGTRAGAMSFGGTDPKLHETPMVYTSTGESDGFYGVYIRKMYLRPGGGGVSIHSDKELTYKQLDISESSLNHGTVIVDSGTTDTYFSRYMSTAFKDAYKEVTGETYTHNMQKVTAEELDKFPTIVFQIAGDITRNKAIADSASGPVAGLAGELDAENPYDVLIAMPPAHYMEYDDESKMYEARFYTDEGSGGVLGANAMMGHDVYFDVDNAVIGWAESDCDYVSKLAENYDGPIDQASSSAKYEIDENERIEPEENEAFPATALVNEEYDEPTLPENEFCSTLTCQAGFLAVVVVSIIVAAVRLLRRNPAVAYEPAGLELQDTSNGNGIIQSTSSEDDDDFVNGREKDGSFNTKYRNRVNSDDEGELA